jgi:hypothetical protein
MKNLMMTGLLILGCVIAYGQRVKNDPTYSINNYKHPNKAAEAKKLNLDPHTNLETAEVNSSDNYKQPFQKTIRRKSFMAASTEANKQRRSSKHPYGL